MSISFLGAGTILKYSREAPRTVEDLATGASILSVSAIGIAIALSACILAIGTALLNVFINWDMMPFIRKAKAQIK